MNEKKISVKLKEYIINKFSDPNDFDSLCTKFGIRSTKYTGNYDKKITDLLNDIERKSPKKNNYLEKLRNVLLELLGSEDFKDEINELFNKSNIKIKYKTKFITTPPVKNIDLIGRDEKLKELDKNINSTDRVLLVNGLGGIGKTELCKKYFWSNIEKYDHVGWIDYISSLKESLVTQIETDEIKFTNKETIDQRYNKIINYLVTLSSNTLLVIDNIENPEDEELKTISSLNIKVISSSRNDIKGFKKMPLDFLSKDDCRELFYTYYEGDKDDEHADKIIELAGYHTLTVELLAKTASNAAMQLKDFFELLNEKGFNLNDVIKEKVDTFWHDEKNKNLFFEHLLKVFDIQGLNTDELYILTNISILPAVFIEINNLKEWLKLESNEIINDLCKKGWLQKKGFMVRIHQVIGEVVRHKIKPDNKNCEQLIISITNCLYNKPGENPLDKKVLILFAEYILKNVSVDDRNIAALLNNLSIIYRIMGNLNSALNIGLQALKICEQLFDKDDYVLSMLYSNLAIIYKVKGDLNQALDFGLKALKISEQIFDEYNPNLATIYNNLSQIYLDKGDLNNSLDYGLKTLYIDEQTYDKNHPNLAISYSNLSMIYKVKGDSNQALDYGLKALNIREKKFNKNHADLALSYNNLSMIFLSMKDLKKALEYGLKALTISEQILDKHHPNLTHLYNNLSSIYLYMKSFKTALSYGLKALDICEQIFKKNHPNLALTYNNLSIIYKNINDLKKALDYGLKSVTIKEQIFDKNHPDLAIAYSNLSTLFMKMKDLKKSLKFGLKAVNIKEQIFDEYHPGLSISYNNLSMIYFNLRDFNHALAFGLKALKIDEHILGKNHPDLAVSYGNLSSIFCDLREYRSALEYCNKSINLLKLYFPGGHPNLDIARENLEYIKKMMKE